MGKIKELSLKIAIVKEQLMLLEDNYTNKIKGEVYNYRKTQLITKINFLYKKIANLGLHKNIYYIRGNANRKLKDLNILVPFYFDLYFIDLDKDDINKLVKFNVEKTFGKDLLNLTFEIFIIKTGQVNLVNKL